METKRFNVCVKTRYRRHQDGEWKEKFTTIGTAYESIMKESGKSVMNLLIGPNVLITENTPIVLFECERETEK